MAKVDMSMVPDEFKSETGRYKPGNDAKHVSALVAEAAEGGFKVAIVKALSKQLPTDNLKHKFEAAVERKKNAPVKEPRAPRAPKEDPKLAALDTLDPADVIRTEERADVKVGRNFYPARIAYTEAGEFIEVNSAKDGSGSWVVAPDQDV